jgi:serine/threonine-protein kinase
MDAFERLRDALRDRYLIERELGRGGMATVYLAHDLKHDRPIALKILNLELATTPGPERFQREIRTTARLQHPHILTVLDSGDAGGLLWYSMPYVDGESLRDRLRREGQLPLDDALSITREVADALGYAHSQGIVHRDIKPGNILLGRGHALVADFGIARALQAVENTEQLTATGMAVGTPAYMAPEQAGGGMVDARTDLYALGCVLYEMLAGEPPFTGPTAQAITIKRLTDSVPSVRRVRETVPEAVELALTRALSKIPADRFATASELAHALTAPVVITPTSAPNAAPSAPTVTAGAPTSRPRLRRPAGVAALALALVAVGAGALFAWRRSRAAGADAGGPTRLAVLPFENLGNPADAYFADGVTDAVRDKLAALPTLEVIASASSNQYRHTAKPPAEVGRELEVRYLLVGRVRWARAASGESRVQVRPELVDAKTGAERWGEPFEAPLTDVFRVQADVAARVAEALGVALGSGERERLTRKPTESLAAYDAFLRGEEASAGLATLELAALQRAVGHYERAVALDSAFALAWAQLSRAHSKVYWNTLTPTSARAARRAGPREMDRAPEVAEVSHDQGHY